MKNSIILLIIFIAMWMVIFSLVPNCECKILADHYGAGWSRENTVKQALGNVIHIIDWGQTLAISKSPLIVHTDMLDDHTIVVRADWKYKENRSAWAIGEHPSTGKVNSYMLGTGVLFNLIAPVLSDDPVDIFGFEIRPRNLFQNIIILDWGSGVAGNFKIGLKCDFNF